MSTRNTCTPAGRTLLCVLALLVLIAPGACGRKRTPPTKQAAPAAASSTAAPDQAQAGEPAVEASEPAMRAASPATPDDVTTAEPAPERPTDPLATPATLYEKAVVASDHLTASQAGDEMLRLGGNAVDAAVATSFALSVTRPYSCGIGGGGFMVIRFDDDQTHGTKSIAINYREMAPRAVTPDYYEAAPEGASVNGGKAVGVPGTVAGLLHALDKYGTLDRGLVLQPAIQAAEAGFVADDHYVSGALALARRFEREPEWQQRFPFVWDRFLKRGDVKVGDRITLPEQAEALRMIARGGASAFYEGPIADAIIAAIQADGGDMTSEDLRAFRVDEMRPLTFVYGEHTFITMPPPSSGGLAMGQILGIYQRILESSGQSVESDVPFVDFHAMVESMKHAFADRGEWLGDPMFAEVPVEQLLSDAYLDDRAALYNPDRTLTPMRYGTHITNDDSGTSHLCVVDASGNAVSCTETINTTFGSKLVVPEFGFCLNNEMDDFTARPGEPNAYGLIQSDRNAPAPGKRPLSSMSPTIVLDGGGRVRIVAGAAGGPRIITSTLQIILYSMFEDGLPTHVMQMPRFHHQWQPDELRVEAGFPRGLIDELVDKGHDVRQGGALGNTNLIRRAGGGWNAAGDPRKGGEPVGH